MAAVQIGHEESSSTVSVPYSHIYIMWESEEDRELCYTGLVISFTVGLELADWWKTLPVYQSDPIITTLILGSLSSRPVIIS